MSSFFKQIADPAYVTLHFCGSNSEATRFLAGLLTCMLSPDVFVEELMKSKHLSVNLALLTLAAEDRTYCVWELIKARGLWQPINQNNESLSAFTRRGCKLMRGSLQRGPKFKPAWHQKRSGSHWIISCSPFFSSYCPCATSGSDPVSRETLYSDDNIATGSRSNCTLQCCLFYHLVQLHKILFFSLTGSENFQERRQSDGWPPEIYI